MEISHWRKAQSAEDVLSLIDREVLLTWSEMRALKRSFGLGEKKAIAASFVKSVCQKGDDRFKSEILVESMLIWLTYSLEEDLIQAIVGQFLLEEGGAKGVRNLVEIGFTSEVVDSEHDDELYLMAVGLVCELGVAISENRETFKKAVETLEHITTYLLSVCNTSSNAIRLSLLHYFGALSFANDQTPFNRVLSRFGYTALDYLFSLLFNKKTEGMALLYLSENLPSILRADMNAQHILHETFKSYMLKEPERFSLFMQTFIPLVQGEGADPRCEIAFIQHLGALFSVANEVHHKHLAREIALAMQRFGNHPLQRNIFSQILAERKVKPLFKRLIDLVSKPESTPDVVETIVQFRISKRGRKPSFSKVDPLSTLSQVAFLGHLSKAS